MAFAKYTVTTERGTARTLASDPAGAARVVLRQQTDRGAADVSYDVAADDAGTVLVLDEATGAETRFAATVREPAAPEPAAAPLATRKQVAYVRDLARRVRHPMAEAWAARAATMTSAEASRAIRSLQDDGTR